MALEEETISKIKVLLKLNSRGLTITEISSKLKMNRNSVAKYLEVLLISGQVESCSYGTARVFFLSHRIPISAMLGISSDLVLALDENHKMVFCNESFLKFFGLTREEIIGKHIVEIYKKNIEDISFSEIFSDILINPELTREIQINKAAEMFFFRIKSINTVFDDGGQGITILMEDITREKKYKLELETKEARYRGIVEDQPEFITRFRPDGTLSFVNSTYARYYGKDPGTLIGEPYIYALLEDDRDSVDRTIRSLAIDDPVASFDCRVLCPSGQVRWQSWTIRAFFDGQANPVEYQGVGRDNMEKREAAAKIQQHIANMEFLSRKLLEFSELPMDTGIFEKIAADLQELAPGSTIFLNLFSEPDESMTLKSLLPERDRELIHRYLGRDPVGTQYHLNPQLFRELRIGILHKVALPVCDIISPSLPESVCEEISRVIESGDIYAVGFVRGGKLLGNAMIVVRKSADVPDLPLVETYVRQATIALQRRLAEDALKESEELYRNVIENIQDVFYRSDLEGRLIMASPSWASVLGYAAMDECLGKNIADAFYFDPAERSRFLEEVRTHGEVLDYEVVLKKKDGSPLHVAVSSHLYYDKSGAPLGIEGIFRDMTERHESSVKIQRYLTEKEFFSKKLQEFIELPPKSDIFEKIGLDLKFLIPKGYIVVCTFDNATGVITLRKMLMGRDAHDLFSSCFGCEPEGFQLTATPETRRGILEGRILHVDRSEFPPLFEGALGNALNGFIGMTRIREIYGIGLVRENEALGVAGVFLPEDAEVPDFQTVEIYVQAAAIALQRHIAEESLSKSEELFSKITAHSPFPISIIAEDGKYLFINSRFTETFGYDLSDFSTGREWFRVAYPDPEYRRSVIAAWSGDLEDSQVGSMRPRTFSVRCKNGEIKEIFFRPVTLTDNKQFVVYEDITDQREADRTRHLLSSIIESTMEAVIGKSVDGIVISWNASAERIYGYTAAEMIGKHISSIIPPDRFPEMEEIIGRVRQGIPVEYLETIRIRKDGSPVDIGMSVSPIRDENGIVIGASTIARDISQQKAEERLRGKEEEYRALVQDMGVGVYRSTGDPMGRFIWGNPALVSILGYPSLDQLKNVKVASIFAEPDGRKQLLDDLRKYGFVKNCPIRLKTPDGKVLAVRVTALAQFDSAGEVSCINGLVEDVTSLQEAEIRLEGAREEIGSLIDFIPHPAFIIDEEKRVVAWNTALEKMTGTGRAEILGSCDYSGAFSSVLPSCPPLIDLIAEGDEEILRYYTNVKRENGKLTAEKSLPAGTAGTDDLPVVTIEASYLRGPTGEPIGGIEIIHLP
ncbi:PAS domain S-box-containing protein [Methanolinea mesophila]|uniref:PAS domain S-box protein n=1 Tax=Methanolinea mesophila TaxID=547055 RepID=UPI001AE167CD|nr:PAS domain S-box protein [Methanolinea mesophila]MBP1928083.1 PAS domain S-box-containing protein [Methanolinea mesophila]